MRDKKSLDRGLLCSINFKQFILYFSSQEQDKTYVASLRDHR